MFRRKPKAPDALDVLVRDLEDLRDADVRAALWAFEIRHDGASAVQRCMVKLAGEFGVGYLSPICAALARYERATTGRDLAAVAPDFVRQRRGIPELEARVADNQRARLARLNQRLSARQLASVRAAAHRGGA